MWRPVSQRAHTCLVLRPWNFSGPPDAPPEIPEALLILSAQPALLTLQQRELLEVVGSRQVEVLDLRWEGGVVGASGAVGR